MLMEATGRTFLISPTAMAPFPSPCICAALKDSLPLLLQTAETVLDSVGGSCRNSTRRENVLTTWSCTVYSSTIFPTIHDGLPVSFQPQQCLLFLVGSLNDAIAMVIKFRTVQYCKDPKPPKKLHFKFGGVQRCSYAALRTTKFEGYNFSCE